MTLQQILQLYLGQTQPEPHLVLKPSQGVETAILKNAGFEARGDGLWVISRKDAKALLRKPQVEVRRFDPAQHYEAEKADMRKRMRKAIASQSE